MAADVRMIFVARSGTEARELRVDKFASAVWASSLSPSITQRTADVEGNVLSTVLVCSAAEALAATAAARAKAGQRMDETVSRAVLQLCDQIAEQLAWVGAVHYYSGWVILETADID